MDCGIILTSVMEVWVAENLGWLVSELTFLFRISMAILRFVAALGAIYGVIKIPKEVERHNREMEEKEERKVLQRKELAMKEIQKFNMLIAKFNLKEKELENLLVEHFKDEKEVRFDTLVKKSLEFQNEIGVPLLIAELENISMIINSGRLDKEMVKESIANDFIYFYQKNSDFLKDLEWMNNSNTKELFNEWNKGNVS